MFASAFGQPAPSGSVLNWSGGQTIANAVILPAAIGLAKDIRIFASSAAHVIVDVLGYFRAPVVLPISSHLLTGTGFLLPAGASDLGTIGGCTPTESTISGSCTASSWLVFMGGVSSTQPVDGHAATTTQARLLKLSASRRSAYHDPLQAYPDAFTSSTFGQLRRPAWPARSPRPPRRYALTGPDAHSNWSDRSLAGSFPSPSSPSAAPSNTQCSARQAVNSHFVYLPRFLPAAQSVHIAAETAIKPRLFRIARSRETPILLISRLKPLDAFIMPALEPLAVPPAICRQRPIVRALVFCDHADNLC